MGITSSKLKYQSKKDIKKPKKPIHPIILPLPTKNPRPKTGTSTNVCRHLKKIVKCLTFFTHHEKVDKHHKQTKRIHKHKVYKLYSPTGNEITVMPPSLLPSEFQLHWLRSKRSLASYALSKLAFFSKISKDKIPPYNSTTDPNPPPSKQIKFCYKNQNLRTTVNATSSTTETEALISTSNKSHQINLYDMKIDQGHQISLNDLNKNLTLKNELLEKILSSPTIGATNDKYNFLRRKRSPEEIYWRNLRTFETLVSLTESLSSIASCPSSVDMASVKLSEKNIQTEQVEKNNNDIQRQEPEVVVLQAETTEPEDPEQDENRNLIIRPSLEKKSSEHVSSELTATPPKRIITRSKSPMEVDTYFMDWVKSRLFKSPANSVEPQSTVVGQVETIATSHSSSSPTSSSSSGSSDTKKDDKDNNEDKNNDKSEKKKGPFEYLRKGGGRRASTAGRDWSEGRSKSRSPDGAERKKKGKGSKTNKSGTATTETSESSGKTEEEGTKKTGTKGKKNEEAPPPTRPCEKCGPCAGKYAFSGAPPAYLDYGEGDSANHPGEAWKGKRKGDPVMDRLKNVDVVEEMTYLVPNSPDCGGGGDAGRGEDEEGEDDCDYYAVCESCGEMEPIPEELKKELQAKRRRKKRKDKGEILPVTYSRRQRFNFKNKGDMCDEDDDGPPYSYEGQQCPGCRCTCCVAGLRRDEDCGCKCCQTMGPLRRCNSFDEIPVGKNPQIRRILPQEEECARRRAICMQQMPDNSGMYQFDKEHKMFERQVPRTPTPIILEVEVPEPLTKEQLLAIGRGIQEKKRLGMPVGNQAHCPPVEQDPMYLPPIYGQCNPPPPCCPPPPCGPIYCCADKPGDGEDKGKKKDKEKKHKKSEGTGTTSSYPPGSSYSYSTGYDDKATDKATSGRTHVTTKTGGVTHSTHRTLNPETLESESTESLLPSL